MAASIPIHLGKGTYGNVVQIDNRAVKSFEYRKPLLQEYAALRYLADTGCKYVVKPVDVDVEHHQLSMEVYDMNLRKWRSKNLQDPNYHNNARIILHDILCGLIELHDRGLVHADFKPGNILIRLEPLGAVLGDVGFVSIAKYTKVDRTGPLYRDPTPVKDAAHDLFSLGMIMFELVTGHHLVKLGNHNDYQRIAQTYVKDPEYLDIIYNLFQADHSQRYSARTLLMRIFGENFPRWEVPDIIAPIIHKPDIRKRFKMEAERFGVRREKLGYLSLLFAKNDPSVQDVAAMLYLLTVMFICDPAHPDPKQLIAPRRFSEMEAMYYAGCTSDELYKTVVELIDNRDVLQIIMSSATKSSDGSSATSSVTSSVP